MPYKCASCKLFFIGATKFKLISMSIDGETLLCEKCYVEEEKEDKAPRFVCRCHKGPSRCECDASEDDAYCHPCTRFDKRGEGCCECDSSYQNDIDGKPNDEQRKASFDMSKPKNQQNKANFDMRDMWARECVFLTVT